MVRGPSCTQDSNMVHHQKLAGHPCAVVVFQGPNNFSECSSSSFHERNFLHLPEGFEADFGVQNLWNKTLKSLAETDSKFAFENRSFAQAPSIDFQCSLAVSFKEGSENLEVTFLCVKIYS